MDKQKIQKLMLAILGVLVLGAGSWFVFFRGPGESTRKAVQEGPVVRKARKVQPKDARKTTARRARKVATASATTRRERKVAEGTAIKRRVRGRKNVKVKKKVDDPWS